jgi:Tol biopolymer transport system component
MRRAAVPALLLSLLMLASCAPAKPIAHDPGKVVLQAKKVSVPGRLYATKNRRLYLFSGTHLTRLVPGTAVVDPAITSDGSQLAYAELQGQSSVIVIADPSGRAARPITPSSAPEGQLWALDPSFSSDGRSIAYLTDRGKQRSSPRNLQPNDLGLWLYNGDTAESSRLVAAIPYTGGDSDPVFRPGALGQIVYTTYLYGGDPLQPVARLSWLSLGTGARVYLSPDGERNFNPAISPDGRFLAFIHATPAGDDLEVMPLDNSYLGEPQPAPTADAVVLQSGMVSQPVWSPDGTAIAFVMLSKGSFDLFILPVSTQGGVHPAGPPQSITDGSFMDADSRLAWGP